jgi:signal transduction histidine kinase
MSKRIAAGRHFETDEMRGSQPALAVYDELGDTLKVIKMQLKSAIQAEARLQSGDGETPNGGFGQADFASLSIRQISAELGSVLLDTLGLAATLEWYVHEFRKCTGIYYDLRIDDALGAGLAEEYATAIFHIFHEALSNIAHHAEAEKIAIDVRITPQEVAMVVSDNGVGIAEAQAGNLNSGGLTAIRKHASSLNGLCRVVGAATRHDAERQPAAARGRWAHIGNYRHRKEIVIRIGRRVCLAVCGNPACRSGLRARCSMSKL